LDTKYGIKTFEPYFAMENTKVGRLVRLPKGTAENGAVYIHATLFAIWSLFEMNEPERAWAQLIKILPPTHSHISTTPFVMPNSYVDNDERGFDGESMSDWFTGSGCVLLKVLMWYVFGVRGDLDGLTVAPASYMPFQRASITLQVKGAEVSIKYKKTGEGRTYAVNGKKMDVVRFSNTEIKGKKITVTVTD
jgi:cellobiose phosphorylase